MLIYNLTRLLYSICKRCLTKSVEMSRRRASRAFLETFQLFTHIGSDASIPLISFNKLMKSCRAVGEKWPSGVDYVETFDLERLPRVLSDYRYESKTNIDYVQVCNHLLSKTFCYRLFTWVWKDFKRVMGRLRCQRTEIDFIYQKIRLPSLPLLES